jgi:tol-pal system protein YbgF
MLLISKHSARILYGLMAVFALNVAQAGLFDDEEARKAILDLRNRVDANRQASEAAQEAQRKSLEESNATLRRSLLELQSQIEALRREVATLRGQDEQLTRDVAEVQRRQKDMAQGFDDRVRRFEPVKVNVDGIEFMAEPTEKRDFDAAFAIFRKPDYAAAQPAFIEFIRRYPQSGYRPSAFFWLGNAQYATRNYSEAMINFREIIARHPDHPKVPEAMLAMANSQIELKDNRTARRTLEDLIAKYPQSEAAGAGRDRLARLPAR